MQEHAYPATVELTDITTVVTNPPCATLSLRSRAELLRDHVKWYGTRILWEVVGRLVAMVDVSLGMFLLCSIIKGSLTRLKLFKIVCADNL